MASVQHACNQTSTLVMLAVPSADSQSRIFNLQNVALAVLIWWSLLCYRSYAKCIKCPGPWLARLSAWPNWYHTVKGDRHRWLHELHVRHGDMVQFAPNAVSINSVSGRDAIYKSPTANVKKADWYQAVRDSAGGYLSTFTARDRAQHSAKRKLLSHAFSDKALRDYEPRIINRVRRWVDVMGVNAQVRIQKIDMGVWSTLLTFDILGELCFGETLGLMESSEQPEIIDLVPQTTGSWYKLGYHPLTKHLRHFLFQTRIGRCVAAKAYRNNARFRAFCLQKFQERSKRSSSVKGNSLGTEGLDIFDYLLHGRISEEGHTYTVGDMVCETVLLMVAGTQSASCALSSTIFYLVNNPSHLARLEDEVRQTFSKEDDIRYIPAQELANLQFLKACIEESMRLSPPTPGHLPREVEIGGLEVHGARLNNGIDVGTSPYAIHRNPKYFEKPNDFNPDRWMNGQRQESMRAFHAFSAGPTGCIGKHLAYMELTIALAFLVWRFDMSTPSPAGKQAEYEMRDNFVGCGEGPVVQLMSRS